ncbi:MAG: DegT/DnrJ/EryC1/StrS family aminotransferase [Spirochaetales bacterium]|nr:DegT/DnrJ/EryC1/StrS family aminotransferase [Spirochaetales bacterium]
MSSSFKKIIPFAKPSIGTDEEDAVLRVLRSGWLTTGRETLAFEKEFQEFVSSKHALAVTSGTAGLHLALEASGVEADQFVITTPYTFAATAEIIRYMHAHPLFVDILPDSYNIDPELVAKAVRENKHHVAAIIPVHIAGNICDMKSLCEITAEKNIHIIEDCAHAFPVKYNGKYAGTLGQIGVYSFYANKTITTGEGGMIATDNTEYTQRMKVMRTHGIDREAWDRYSAQNKWYYEIIEPGFKYNLSDIASAIGRVQLTRANDFLEKRRHIANIYIRELSGLDFLHIPAYTDDHAWHLFMIRIQPEYCTLSRNVFIEKLSENGIGTSVHYTPLHIMPYYKNKYGYKPDDFPVSLANSQACISLPIYPDLDEEDLMYIIQTVKKIGQAHRPVHTAVPGSAATSPKPEK